MSTDTPGDLTADPVADTIAANTAASTAGSGAAGSDAAGSGTVTNTAAATTVASGSAADPVDGRGASAALTRLLRPDLVGRTAYGAPQLDVPVALNTNENSYAVPPEVVDDIVAAVAAVAPGLNRYPDREFTALREDLAAYLTRVTGTALTPEQLWAANGSNEVLLHLLQAFGGPGRVALGFTPSYSMHPIITRTTGTRWVDGERGAGHRPGADGRVPPVSYDLIAEHVVRQVREHDPHVVFLCSPNNPTGTAVGLDIVEATYDAAPNALVVVDEAYAEFARPGTPSATTLLAGRPRLVVSRTMSKAFALAGGRVGYLAADPALVDALRLVRMPYHLSSPTQAVARAALAHADTLLGTVEAIKAQRDRIVAETRALGLEPVDSDANFVLVGGFARPQRTWQALLDAGVLVRDVGITGHLRVTAGTPAETDAFLAALGAHLREHPDALVGSAADGHRGDASPGDPGGSSGPDDPDDEERR
ncbi:histidinol-phosphate transaminase [Piscicoccus intestinalis]|uniref:histidinol-phosphate transaminase n=1 Tax=Piscicoccus intestinalis TaxID=746033 RepID=UPI000A00C548|nr:histidinol-phosphate transaminase [Piscicoccus intestinalis]